MSLKGKVIIAVCACAANVLSASAQSSSINTFSPYTFYGIGDFYEQGTAQLRGMGGASIAFRSPIAVNSINPASYSAIPRKTAIFDVGGESRNFYLQQGGKNSSYNTINISNITLAIPIYNGIGLGINVAPFSNVGYRISLEEDNPDIVAQGKMNFIYDGEGGVTQFKLGVGAQLFKGVSLGVDFIYYLGSISRDYTSSLTNTIGNSSFNTIYGTDTYNISQANLSVGLQADLLTTNTKILTLGATYQPRVTFNQKVTRDINSSSVIQDSVTHSYYRSPYVLPDTWGVGLFYHSTTVGIGVDYVFQKWEGLNSNDATNGISYENVHLIRAGIEYTPNRGDIRHYMKRVTYRLGGRVGTNYLTMDGNKTRDMAVSFGFGFPVKMNGMSHINLGAELGQRGTNIAGGLKEKYIKISLGISLFGEDFWFVKPQYD